MNQTAVEWLLKELEEQKLIKLDKLSTILFNKNFATRYELIIHQALAMEKEQIMDSYIMGSYDMAAKEFRPEQYYNETYGKVKPQLDKRE
jgi:hypothetical protein